MQSTAILNFVTFMSEIAIIWLFLSIVLSGIGLLVRKVWGLHLHSVDDWFTAFWLGWACVIAWLQIVHLFLPIDWRSFTAVLLAGFLGWAFCMPDASKWLALYPMRRLFPTAILLMLAIWLANRAALPASVGDTGLYHLQAIKWAATYPTVPGLGNLHGRLAFNNAHFLYVAMLDAGPWLMRSHHLANGLFFLVVLAQCTISGLRLLGLRGSWDVMDAFYFLLLGPVLYQASGAWVPNPAADPIIFLLGIVISGLLLRYFNDQGLSDTGRQYSFIALVAIAFAGVCVKISFAAFGGTAVLVAMLAWLLSRGAEKKFLRSGFSIPVVTICAGTLLLPWAVNGVVLSGYIAYPSTLGGFPVDWRIPSAKVIEEAEWVQSWARMPFVPREQVLDNLDWLYPWAERVFKDYYQSTLPLLIALAAFIFWRILVKTSRWYECSSNVHSWLVMLPPSVSLVYWFLAAPDLRFLGSSLWVLAASSMALVAQGVLSPLPRASQASWILVVGLLLVMPPFRWMGLRVAPGPDNGLYSTPIADLAVYETASGLAVYVPQEGDSCFEAPLPCAPFSRLDPLLQLRNPSSLAKGFKIELTK